jgi:hypothetical protein
MEEKGPSASREVDEGAVVESGDRISSAPPVSGIRTVTDEAARTRLMADITRLIHEPGMPEPTRLAGLTLIGWLARRRAHEPPHAIGIVEARESEKRLRAARSKAR